MATVSADDWRLSGQERYLKGVTLRHMQWEPRHPDNDHDHCEFCWAKLAAPRITGSIQDGYCTEDRYHWICPECFHDFKEQFKWSLAA